MLIPCLECFKDFLWTGQKLPVILLFWSFCHPGLITESGGIAKVTSFEESNKHTLDAIEKAIQAHKDRKKIEIPERKYEGMIFF